MFPDTATLEAVLPDATHGQGIQTDTNGCTKRNWNGERAWTAPDRSLGGHVACYLDANGDSVDHLDAHEPRTTKDAPPQPDHRDILGDRTPAHPASGRAADFWKFWSGASGTASTIGKLRELA